MRKIYIWGDARGRLNLSANGLRHCFNIASTEFGERARDRKLGFPDNHASLNVA
jgi:hypothetical protein